MRQWGLVVLVCVACGGSKESKEQANEQAKPVEGSGSAAASGTAVAVAVDAAPAVPVAPPDAAPLVDLPPLVVGEADEETIKKSVNLNNAGYVAHKKQDWPTAEAKYTEAVRADPGNLRARFNLACVYSSSDQADKAFFVLAQFKQADCRACDAVLLKAKADREWQARLQDPRFVVLQDGLAPTPTDLKQATRALQKALRAKKPDGLEPYIHPRNPIKVTEVAYGEEVKPEYFYGWPGLVRLLGTMITKLELNDIRSCAKSCCTTGERGDSSFVVDKVCFEGGGDVLFVSSIEFDSGPI